MWRSTSANDPNPPGLAQSKRGLGSLVAWSIPTFGLSIFLLTYNYALCSTKVKIVPSRKVLLEKSLEFCMYLVLLRDDSDTVLNVF